MTHNIFAYFTEIEKISHIDNFEKYEYLGRVKLHTDEISKLNNELRKLNFF
ncbi:hypothetical protein SAMN05444369_108123 [Capnocytophaga haemolytica]|jgi:hypothetical protein|uniref:Uncharacterized protein n=1 Tax=Capnocytophaga haemolytica TaxID=45243 RepID=A0AAX2H0V7_9FLAO|nr:hypothetical protein [Capnocytophaga haemolytica]SFO07970.1 hypothetical protein SAMN05444369_108123 [Capnocytophaga haemolytica]SNV13075.1 Uncharacterised protein [Capnocytophaga haemolytica]